MAEVGLELIPVHEIQDQALIERIAEALNAQWKRSLSARLHSLKKSTPEFPMTVALVDTNQAPAAVVGTAKLSRALEDSNHALVESVLVVPGSRGQGIGRLMMAKCEYFLAGNGCTRVLLSTHDQEGFYRRIGYRDGYVVSPLSTLTSRLKGVIEPVNPSIATDNPIGISTPPASLGTGPPPPPPPPPPSAPATGCDGDDDQQIWLMKDI
eukprot:m.134204 g.134204  ORF g.134204 m.134204 type:complete len:210 (-) comp15971_c0_seq11:82-711(-)